MDEKKVNHVKNLVITFTGIILSLAGIVYIAVQYSKLLSTLILKKEDESEADACATKLQNRFKQVSDNDGVEPTVIEDDDLSAEIE